MLSEPTQTIPIIDLHNDDATIVKEIDDALQKYGFFYIQNHDISQELVEQQFDISQKLFDLPVETKTSMPFSPILDIGYLGSDQQALEKTLLLTTESKEEKESTEQEEEETAATTPSDTKEQFMMTNNKVITSSTDLEVDPDNVFDGSQNYDLSTYLPDHGKVTSSYISAVYKLVLRLHEYLFDALELTNDQRTSLSEHPFVVLKQMKYDGCILSDPSKGIYGAGPHTDWGSFTVLANKNSVKGLQVLSQESNKWVDVPPIPNTFIINAGDQISILTNQKYKSALHRVLIQDQEVQEASLELEPQQAKRRRYVRYTTAVFAYFGIHSKFHPPVEEEAIVNAEKVATTSSSTSASSSITSNNKIDYRYSTTKEYFHYKLHQSVGVVTTTTAGDN
jgi:isopenicillin N synthase-like dioxygenase